MTFLRVCPLIPLAVCALERTAPAQLARLAWTAEGNEPFAFFGASASAAGDVNGDGLSDVLVGAPGLNEARVFLYLGTPAGLAKLPSWTAQIDQEDDNLGADVAGAGDVNGDGFDDVLLGASGFSHGQLYEGAAFLYLGSAAGPGAEPAWTLEGELAQAHLGRRVASAGDVNGDGFADILVAVEEAPGPPLFEGVLYLFLGSDAGPAASPAWTGRGSQRFSGFGSAASAGDVNGDGFSDVLVGEPSYDNIGLNEGRALLYLGSAQGLSALPAWSVETLQQDVYLGSYVSADLDVDADGFDDVLVGTPGYSSDGGDVLQQTEGQAALYLGSPTGPSAAPDWAVEGNQRSAGFAVVASAGDVDGDGYDDVLVGGPSFDAGQANEGIARLYLGSAAGLATRPAWSVEGDQRNASLGRPVGTVGDVNGDGFDDLIVVAVSFDNGERDEGRSFVYLGSPRYRLR